MTQCIESRYLGNNMILVCGIEGPHRTHTARFGGQTVAWGEGLQCSARKERVRCRLTLEHGGYHSGLSPYHSSVVTWPDEPSSLACGDMRFLREDGGGIYCIETGAHDLHHAQPSGMKYFWTKGVAQCDAVAEQGQRCFWDAGHQTTKHASIHMQGEQEGRLFHFEAAETCSHIRVIGPDNLVRCANGPGVHSVHGGHMGPKLIGWRTDEDQCNSIGPSKVRCYQSRGHSGTHLSMYGKGGPIQRWSTTTGSPNAQVWSRACSATKVVDGSAPLCDRTLHCALEVGHGGTHEGFTNASGTVQYWGENVDAVQAALKQYIKEKINQAIAEQTPKPRTYAERKRRKH